MFWLVSLAGEKRINQFIFVYLKFQLAENILLELGVEFTMTPQDLVEYRLYIGVQLLREIGDTISIFHV